MCSHTVLTTFAWIDFRKWDVLNGCQTMMMLPKLYVAKTKLGNWDVDYSVHHFFETWFSDSKRTYQNLVPPVASRESQMSFFLPLQFAAEKKNRVSTFGRKYPLHIAKTAFQLLRSGYAKAKKKTKTRFNFQIGEINFICFDKSKRVPVFPFLPACFDHFYSGVQT